MTNKNIKIEDNLLKQEDFDKIQEIIMFDASKGLQTLKSFSQHSAPFPWFYADTIDFHYADTNADTIDFQDEVDKFQFIHNFYNNHMPTSPFMNELGPILEIIQPLSIRRIKANLLTKTPKIVENTFHVDFRMAEEKLSQWTTSIFYVNTNNGYTLFEDGTKVESVANRMITFPNNIKHRGTSCTDEKTRVLINFNYFK